MKKRILSVLLVLSMLLTLVPSAFADGLSEGTVATIGEAEFTSLQAAIDETAKEAGTHEIKLVAGVIEENVTVVQKAGVYLTITGAEEGTTLKGMITVDGQSSDNEERSLTIDSVDIEATAGGNCIFVPGGSSRYSKNLTVKNCDFTGEGAVALKQSTGGCKNWLIQNCTVDSTMHSFLQVANVTGLVIDGCTVQSKNGINLSSSEDVEIKNSTVDVRGYAVRAGASSGGSSGAIALTENTLKTDNSEGDAVVILRGTAATQVDLDMSKNVVSGDTHISGTMEATDITANNNYWDGETDPVVSGAEVDVRSYYSDEELTELVVDPALATAQIGDNYYMSIQEAIDAVKDGDTIVILQDTEVTQEDATNNNAVYYTGDASFTIDFNNKTVTGDTSNVVFRFQKAEGGKENSIVFKNGKIISTENCWSAVSIGSDADTKTYVELTDMEFEANKGGDFAVRARAGAVFTLTDCSITSRYAGGVLAGGGEVTLNNVTVDQKGLHTAPYNSTAAAVHSNGKMTINSGSYTTEPLAASDAYNQGTSYGSWCVNVMNSGGTLIINDGTFANGNFGDDALATNPRECVVLGAAAGATAKIIINGGTFNSIGAMVYTEGNVGTTHTMIANGNFTAKKLLAGKSGAENITVGGGISSYEVAEQYLAEGYQSVMSSATGLYYILVDPGAEMVAQINGGIKYQTIEEAIAAANDGDVIKLLADIELKKTLVLNRGISFTLDGNGYKIVNDGATNTALMVGDTTFAVDNADAPVYTLKNIVFDGWTTAHVVRVQGVNAVVEGCTFQNCVQPANGLALLSFNYSFGTVKDCVFKNNTAAFDLIDINSWADGSQSTVTIEGCEFIDNICPIVGAIYYHCGSSFELKDSKFEGNECAMAPVFLGLAGANDVVFDCTFAENVGGSANGIFVEGDATLIGIDESLIPSEAKIGNHYYEKFADAFAAVGEEDVLTLLKEIKLEEALVLDGTYAINGVKPDGTIELLDGASLTAPEGWNVIANVEGKALVYAEGTYVLKNLYTVIYTDGVEGEEIFKDQTAILVDGSATPAFEGTIAREGYTFKGWTPAVAATVTADATYVAVFEKLPEEPKDPVVPEEPKDPVVPEEPKDPITPEKPAEPVFEDVSKEAYYAGAVEWAAKNKVTTGVADGVFAPEVMCTRAQVVTFLWRAAGSPKASADTEVSFTDIKEGSYYYDAVVWAVENKITNGVSATKFAPEAICTRAQVVTFLWRAAGAPKVEATMDFKDVEAGTYYYDAVLWAAVNGVTNGVSATEFAPEANSTRAQAITLVYRAFN